MHLRFSAKKFYLIISQIFIVRFCEPNHYPEMENCTLTWSRAYRMYGYREWENSHYLNTPIWRGNTVWSEYAPAKL